MQSFNEFVPDEELVRKLVGREQNVEVNARVPEPTVTHERGFLRRFSDYIFKRLLGYLDCNALYLLQLAVVADTNAYGDPQARYRKTKVGYNR